MTLLGRARDSYYQTSSHGGSIFTLADKSDEPNHCDDCVERVASVLNENRIRGQGRAINTARRTTAQTFFALQVC